MHTCIGKKIDHHPSWVWLLASLGAVRGGISAIFVLCGTVVATVGCATGAALGLLSAHYLNDVNDWLHANIGFELFPTELYDMDRIPYRIEADWVASVLVAAFILSVVVAWLPARRAGRMDPVKALSYE